MATAAAVEVHVPGVTLAALLTELASSSGDTEGLLLGAVSVSVVTSLVDGGDAVSERHVTRIAVSALARAPRGGAQGAGTCSFYDPNGALDAELLRAHGSPEAAVVGWYKCRRWTPLVPSSRELAVQDALARHAGAPVVLALLTEREGAGGAGVLTSDYRLLVTRRPGEAPLQVEPTVTNLVSGSGVEYASLAASSSSPLLMASRGVAELLPGPRAGEAPRHVKVLEDAVRAVNDQASAQQTLEQIAQVQAEIERAQGPR
eukprot:m51a1_g276 hypothetical protein (260) ;mRNA; r:267385-268672